MCIELDNILKTLICMEGEREREMTRKSAAILGRRTSYKMVSYSGKVIN